VLVHQIERNLYRRQGRALTNFARILPAPQSELAQQLLKDPYNFDFLSLGQEAQERDIERGLTEHIRAVLLELGLGFAFVGRQYHLEVASQDYYSVSPNTRSSRRSPIILRGACRLSRS
jgi:predicted nuclease of restriction endonuclease-like (RecB) superfamily